MNVRLPSTRPSRRSTPPTLLLIALVASASAPAAEARADVLLHDGGVDKDADASGRVVERTGRVPSLILNAEVLSGPTRVLAGNVSLERCEGGAIAVDPDARLAEVADLVLAFQLEDAIASLDKLATLFPCSERPVPQASLAAMSFLRGAALLDLGDDEQAAKAMRDALAIRADYPGEVGFPAPHGALLEAQRSAPAAKSEPAPLSIWVGRAEGEVWVDGVRREDPSREGVAVGSGRHLVQIVTERSTTGMWVRTDGSPAVLVLPGAGPRIWADGGRSPGGEPAMRLLLAEEFGGSRGDIHVLHYRGRKLRGSTFPADGGPREAWGETEDDPPASTGDTSPTPRARAPRPADPGGGRVRIAVGGGYQFVMPFHYGLAAADVSVRPVGPLIIAAFARPGFARVEAVGSAPGGLAIFVPFGAGAGVQKPGDIAPYVLVGGQVAINRDGPEETAALGGVVVQGGIDLSPPGAPIFVRVQGEVGNLNLHLAARAWGGIGVRF